MLDYLSQHFLWILLGYLLGSISSAIIVCKLAKLPDPRTQGSGNPGATNVLRVGGKKMAALTLAGDLLKGFIAVMIVKLSGGNLELQILTGMAAFLGHLYPLFFGFKGGKGVATGIGVLLAASWMVGLCTVATWLFVAKILHISSLSALIAFVLTPVYAWWLEPNEPTFLLITGIMSVILIWRHRSNIRNLVAGTES